MIVFFVALTLAHTCIHDEIHAFGAEHRIMDPQSHRKRANDADLPVEPMRVYFDTRSIGDSDKECMQVGQTVTVNGKQFTCTDKDILSQTTKNLLIQVLGKLQEEMGKMLRIIRSDEFTITDRSWCYDSKKDLSRYTASSSDAVRQSMDTLMVVSTWPTDRAIAWASFCRVDQLGRPIAGHMNFGPASIASSNFNMIYAVAMHELMHALGFHGQSMKAFLDRKDGSKLNAVTTATLGDRSKGTKTVKLVSTPAVLRETRAFYGCPNAKGKEIENYGSGSAGSHWEQRISNDEVMSPQASWSNAEFGPRVSRITLAYFEDMGFYFPDYTRATPFAFGVQQGCAFLEEPARERRLGYSCPGDNKNTCTADGLGGSVCALYNYPDTTIDLFERPVVDAPSKGGSSVYADFMLNPAVAARCTTGQFGRESTPGPEARCIKSNLSRWVGEGIGCYERTCPTSLSAPEPTTPQTPTNPSEPSQPSQPSSPTTPNPDAFTSCEMCANAGFEWCDYGSWVSIGGSWDRRGVCATSCPSFAKTVSSAAQCYSPCDKNGAQGVCRDASQCLAAGGVSWGGTSGCRKDPGTVRCCVGAEPLRKRSVEAVEAVEASSRLTYKVGNTVVACPVEGGTARFSGGSIECPSLEDACCSHRNFCSGRGECVLGGCKCNQGWHGASCELAAESPPTSIPRPSWWNRRIAERPSFAIDEGLPSLDEGEEDLPEGTLIDFPEMLGGGNSSEDTPTTESKDLTLILVVLGGVVVVAALIVGIAITFFVMRQRSASHV